MSTFNNGNGDLESTSLPAAFAELAFLIQAEEKADVQITNRIQITIDSDAGTLSVGTTQLVSRAVDTTGKVMDTVTNYLGSAFNPGTGGTLKSVTKLAALTEKINHYRFLIDKNSNTAYGLNGNNNKADVLERYNLNFDECFILDFKFELDFYFELCKHIPREKIRIHPTLIVLPENEKFPIVK